MQKKPKLRAFKGIRIDLLRAYREANLLRQKKILEENKKTLSLFIERNPVFLKRFSPEKFTPEKFIETLLSPLTPKTRYEKAKIASRVWEYWRRKEGWPEPEHQPLYQAVYGYLAKARYGKTFSPIIWVDNAIIGAERFLKKQVGIKHQP